MSDSDTNTNTNKWRAKELGALWARQGKTQNYFSGYVTVGELGFEKKVRIVGFKNNFKDSENQPDFRLYESEDQEQRSSAESPKADSSNTESPNTESPNTESPESTESVEGEDQDLI